MKFLSDILVKAGAIVDNYIAIGTSSPIPGYNIDSRGSHAFGDFTQERYHYFQSGNVSGGSTLSVYANNTSANSSRSHIMLADQTASVPTRFGLGVYTGTIPYAYLDSASTLALNNASGTNVVVGGYIDEGFKLDVIGSLRSRSLQVSQPSYLGTAKLEQIGDNTTRISGGPQETIVFGPDNGIQVNTNVFRVNAQITQLLGYSTTYYPGHSFSATNFLPAGGTQGLVFAGNFTNNGAGGTYAGSNVVGGCNISTAIGNITLNQFSVENTINTTAGTTLHRGFYYNPTISGNIGLTNIAFESTSGIVKISDLSGTGTRIVVADPTGTLSAQSFSTIANIYNSDGTLTSARVLNTGIYSLTVQSSTTNTGAQFFKIQNSSSQLALIAADDRTIYMPHVAAIGTTTANAQARLTVVGSSVYSKSLALDSTWDYQTSWSMKNGVYSAEFNLGGATKSAAEGGPGSLQISTYNATTATYRYPITFFATGNVGFAGGSGLVPSDNGSTVQITGSLRVSALAGSGTRIVVADAFGVVSTQTPSSAISNEIVTDYDTQVVGNRNSINTIFTTSQNFVSGSTRVFVNGIRYTRGAGYDYTETASNQITFTNAPDSGDLITIDYIKA